jgi:hypothetical protein
MTFWFITYTLLGPGICCCTLSASPATSSAVAASSTKPKPRKCCCQHDKAEGKSDHAPQPCPPNGCPCKRVKADTQGINPAPASNEVSQFFRSVLNVFPEVLPTLGLQVFVWTLDAGNSSQIEQPFVTTEDLLRAFHILRC